MTFVVDLNYPIGPAVKLALAIGLQAVLETMTWKGKPWVNLVVVSAILVPYALPTMLKRFGYVVDPWLTEEDVVLMNSTFVAIGMTFSPNNIDPEAGPHPAPVPLQQRICEEANAFVGVLSMQRISRSILLGIIIIISSWRCTSMRDKMIPKGTAGHLDQHRILRLHTITFTAAFMYMSNVFGQNVEVQNNEVTIAVKNGHLVSFNSGDRSIRATVVLLLASSDAS